MLYNGRHNQTKEQTIMENNKKIVEIDGIKLEIDMRTAKRIDQFKVGDKVKILVKKYDTFVLFHNFVFSHFIHFLFSLYIIHTLFYFLQLLISRFYQ